MTNLCAHVNASMIDCIRKAKKNRENKKQNFETNITIENIFLYL